MLSTFPSTRGGSPMYVPDKDYVWTDPITKVERQVGVKGVAMTLADAVRYGIVTPEDATKQTAGVLPVETKEARDARLATLTPAVGSFGGVTPIGEPAKEAPSAPTPEEAGKKNAAQQKAKGAK